MNVKSMARDFVGWLASTFGIRAASGNTTITPPVSGGTVRLYQGGAVPTTTNYVEVSHDGTNALVVDPTGNAINFGSTIQHRTSNTNRVTVDAGGVTVASGNTFDFSSTTHSSQTPDTGLKRAAAGIVATTDGSSGAGWIQNTAGRSRVTTSNVTNNTTTMAAITGLTFTTIAGRKYAGKLGLWVSNSTAANGIKFDLDGGAGTWTSIQTAFSSNLGGNTLGVISGTAIATDLTVTTLAGTGTYYLEITFAGVANAAGTVIPRFAENSTGGGLASVIVDSFMMVEDMP
jgi:hypothetical protein